MATKKKKEKKVSTSGLERVSLWLHIDTIAALKAKAKADSLPGFPELNVGFLIRRMVEEALEKRKS